jgi:peptide/nickel transport system substrate-binding protein
MAVRRLTALLSLLVLVLAACSGGGEAVEGEGLAEEPAPDAETAETADGADGADGAETPADGAGEASGTFVAATSSQPDQLDPHQTTAYPSFQVLENVYDTLVVPDAETLEMQPSLATEWETSDDGLTWTFTLQEGVTFHDGSELDSADVAYSYNRIIDEELQNAFRFANVESIETPDPQTVTINLSAPTPNLLANLGGFKGMAILPEGAAEDLDLATEANGTGPFSLESQSPDGITLAANPDYWGEGPFVEEVLFRFISEPTTALTELQTGNVQWTDNVPPQQLEPLSSDDSVTLESVPSQDYWYWTANFDVEPFGDPQVREALAYAIDREAITEAARFGGATVNQTAIPESSFWYTDYAPYEHDPERARQLLEEAGVSDLTMGLMVTDEFPETITAAEVMASQLSEVGIDVEIQSETFATWLQRQGDGDYDAFMLGWLGNLDPFGYYHAQHICEGSSNFQNYCNEEVDELLNSAASEQDQDQRKELYDQAAQQIVDDNSYWFLYNPDVVQAWSPDISGYTIRPDKAINFETVQIGG